MRVSVKSRVHKAIVLAAGKGSRMGELTRDLPKPMLAVGGKPVLEHVLERMADAGVTDVVLVVGHHGEQIRRHFEKYPMRLEFREQTEVNGTARATLLAREFAGGDPFLLTFGDILSNPQDYTRLIELLTAETEAVVAVQWAPDPYRGAAVYEVDGRVTRIIEKPPAGTSSTNWNSAGIYVFRPSLFAECERVPVSPRGEYELTSAVSQILESGRVVKMCPLAGVWLDVGRPEDLATATNLLSGESSSPKRSRILIN